MIMNVVEDRGGGKKQMSATYVFEKYNEDSFIS